MISIKIKIIYIIQYTEYIMLFDHKYYSIAKGRGGHP